MKILVNLGSKTMFYLVKKFLIIALGSVILSTLVERPITANNMTLTETELKQKIQSLPDWTREGDVISRTFVFKDFVAAIAFVNQLVEPAEAAGHHPDLEISYNRVKVSLTTHDAGGLTQKDFDLAETISQLD